MKDNQFKIVFSGFYQGFSPVAHLNSKTEMGSSGQASSMQNVDILTPDYITQGPGLSTLTNGDENGVVDETINFILDKAVSSSVTYGIGDSKLFKITPTTVSSGGSPSWPQTITNCTDGSSLIDMGSYLYGFYNTTAGSAGDILRMTISTGNMDVDWGSTTPTGAATLQGAPHPSASKEDIICFGNGRYLGTYVGDTDTLAPTKLDFGSENQVDDVIFNANQWWIAVNSSISGTNRVKGEIFIYDGAAISSVLTDETGVGIQRIGFLYVLNGVIYVAYQDLSSTGGYSIGYISGRQIKFLRAFTGSLPNFQQKTLYKNTILFASSGSLWSCGAVVASLPIQISQIADGGYSTIGAVAAPFGTPMIASTDGSSSYKLAKFNGYDTSCTFDTIFIDITNGKKLGSIDDVIVYTNSLGSSARCDLSIDYNYNYSLSSAQQITTAGKRRHHLKDFDLPSGGLEDFRLHLSWANGNATNNVSIRKMVVLGHYIE